MTVASKKLIFPPHPKGKIRFAELAKYEKSGLWVAQRKFNGTHIVIYVPQDRSGSYILNRHGGEASQFTLGKKHLEELNSLNLDPALDYWLNGELLNNRTTTLAYKGRIVLYDVLHAGRYLFGKPSTLGRIELLDDICRHPTELESNNGIALKVTENIWMAETFKDDFLARYKDLLNTDEIEGLMLKLKSASLNDYGQQEYHVPWLMRCRKPDRAGSYEW